MEVENEVQLADITEVFVQNLNKALHEFKYYQFVLVLVDDGDEIETGKALVYYLVLLVI